MPLENKLYPFLQIKQPYGLPSHKPFSLYATSDVRWDAALANGGIKNLRRFSLDQTTNSLVEHYGTDDIMERRNRAVSLDYALHAQDEYNSLAAWETVATTQESQQLQDQSSKYQLLIDELEEEDSLTPTEQELLASYRTIVYQCRLVNSVIALDRVGFVERIPSVFGLGGYCLHDTNGVPNINKIRRSTFMLDKDRPFHLSLKFATPHEEQQHTAFEIRWGPFKLEFRQGRQVVLSMYSKAMYDTEGRIDFALIDRKEADLNAYLDQGRMTAADRAFEQTQRDKIHTLEQEVKDKKIRHDSPAYRDYYNQIEAAKRLIAERQKLKQHMPAASRRAAEIIKAELYQVYEQNVSLNESDENFYNVPLRLTILPQRRGFITLALKDREPVSVDLPDIIESKSYRSLWQPSLIMFKSNGGAFWWQFAYPAVESWGEYRIRNVPVPFEIFDEDIVYALVDADGQANAEWGTNLQFTFEPSPAAADSPGWSADNPLYDFIATFTSAYTFEDSNGVTRTEGRYIPWLYSLQFFIASGTRIVDETVSWDSTKFTLTPTNPNPNLDNPIINVQSRYESIYGRRRAAAYIVSLHDINGTLGLSEEFLRGRLCDYFVGLWNANELVHGVVRYLRNGYIKEAVAQSITSAGDEIGKGVETVWTLTILDLWDIVNNYTVEDEIILDGLTLGAATRLLLRLPGLTDADIAGVAEEGEEAGPLIDQSGVGERAAMMPTKGRPLSVIFQDLYEEYGMTAYGEEINLYLVDGVFTMGTQSQEIKFTFSSADDVTGPQIVKAGVSAPQNWDNFYNIYEVQGRRNRVTKQRPTANLIVPGSLDDPTSPVYYPLEKRFPTVKKDSLIDQASVERAVESIAIRNSKSGDERNWESWFQYPPVYPGDIGTIDGSLVEIISIPVASLEDATYQEMVTRRYVSPLQILTGAAPE